MDSNRDEKLFLSRNYSSDDPHFQFRNWSINRSIFQTTDSKLRINVWLQYFHSTIRPMKTLVGRRFSRLSKIHKRATRIAPISSWKSRFQVSLRVYLRVPRIPVSRERRAMHVQRRNNGTLGYAQHARQLCREIIYADANTQTLADARYESGGVDPFSLSLSLSLSVYHVSALSAYCNIYPSRSAWPKHALFLSLERELKLQPAKLSDSLTRRIGNNSELIWNWIPVSSFSKLKTFVKIIVVYRRF